MTLPEALKIVSDNANGIAAHNYFDVYLPAILMVNAAFPVVGYTAVEETDVQLAERTEDELVSEDGKYAQKWGT